MGEKVDVLAVLDAFAAAGGQVCCGMAQGGGWDENGNGEPPTCCSQPFSADDLKNTRNLFAELAEASAEMLRLAKGPAGGVSQADKRAIIARVESALAEIAQ